MRNPFLESAPVTMIHDGRIAAAAPCAGADRSAHLTARNSGLTSGPPRGGEGPSGGRGHPALGGRTSAARHLSAWQTIIQRIRLLGRQRACDLAHHRKNLLHDITA